MNVDQKTTLAALLGVCDAPWLPSQYSDLDRGGSIYVARRDGVGTFGDELRTASQRVAAGRVVGSLVAEGLVVRTKRNQTIPTAIGFRIARALAWPFAPDMLDTVVRRINECEAQGAYVFGLTDNEHWIPCDAITGSNKIEDAGLLARCVLPLLAAKLLDSACSTGGRQHYRLLAGPIQDTQHLVDPRLDLFEDRLADIYQDQLRRSRDRVLRIEAQSEMGQLPIHAGPRRDAKRHGDVEGLDRIFKHYVAA